MAYTPINWQTGDVITAEKLNKMDNGWGVENTQLFSETVTTVDDEGINYGTLAFTSFIDADSIVVTFDGTEYTCSKDSPIPVISAYGAPEEEGGYDFSTYPFYIGSSNIGGSIRNVIATSTAGEHTVTVGIPSVEVSGNFAAAVETVVDTSALPMLCVDGVTTYAQMQAAGDRILYFKSTGVTYYITGFNNDVSPTAVSFIPSAGASLSAGFNEDMVFTVSDS